MQPPQIRLSARHVGASVHTALEVETRFLRGPRAYEASGLPFHEDNQTIIKERFYLDKADRNTLR
jgi:hypothetical protein